MDDRQWKKREREEFTVSETNLFQIKLNSLTNTSHKFIHSFTIYLLEYSSRKQQTNQKSSLTALGENSTVQKQNIIMDI